MIHLTGSPFGIKGLWARGCQGTLYSMQCVYYKKVEIRRLAFVLCVSGILR
jgi:hypothetical protein